MKSQAKKKIPQNKRIDKSEFAHAVTAPETATKLKEGSFMAHKNNQCIHCSVESCQHHAVDNMCSLADIQVAPKKDCCDGKCDESQCASYKSRW